MEVSISIRKKIFHLTRVATAWAAAGFRTKDDVLNCASRGHRKQRWRQKTNCSRAGRDDRAGSEVGLIRYRHRRFLDGIAPVIAVGVLSTGDFWPLPHRDQRRPIDHARRPGHREDAFVLDT